MKVWQLAYPHNLQHVNAPDLKLSSEKVKVKITKALLTESDVAVYSGAIKVKAPFVPGRFAIGQVTEANEDSFIKKGERVYLAGVTEDECSPDGLRIAGETSEKICAAPATQQSAARTCSGSKPGLGRSLQ